MQQRAKHREDISKDSFLSRGPGIPARDPTLNFSKIPLRASCTELQISSAPHILYSLLLPGSLDPLAPLSPLLTCTAGSRSAGRSRCSKCPDSPATTGNHPAQRGVCLRGRECKRGRRKGDRGSQLPAGRIKKYRGNACTGAIAQHNPDGTGQQTLQRVRQFL